MLKPEDLYRLLHPEPADLSPEELRLEIIRLDDYLSIFKKSDAPDTALVTDLIQQLRRAQAELARRNGHTVQGDQPLIQLMETIEREDVDFLWKWRIPRGKLTDFSGDPGIGKSTVASAIAATLSKGLALPGDSEPEAPLRSLIVSSEDTPADVLKPRLEKMEADMSLIAIPNTRLNLSPSQVDAVVIDQMLEEYHPALLIIDPIIAYAQGRNTGKASEMREFLGPLCTLAEKHKCAVIMVRHFTKDSKMKALYRSQGSIDFVAISRSAWIFGDDLQNAQRRYMSQVKNSLGPLQPTQEFYIEDGGIFRWGNESDQTADEMLTPSNTEARKTKAAVKFLEEFLKDGAMPSNEIKDAARKLHGVSWATIWKAKDSLEIKASKESGIWFWRLP